MVKVPVAVALKVTGAAQLELVVPGLRAQLVGVKLPPVGLLLKLTVPRGADFVPLSVSVTVAVQVVEPPRGISGAAQLVGVKLPPVGLLLKLTVPRGADFVPLSVSVTVAVQVVEPPRGISGAAQ